MYELKLKLGGVFNRSYCSYGYLLYVEKMTKTCLPMTDICFISVVVLSDKGCMVILIRQSVPDG